MLSHRLQSIANLIGSANKLADVGCDHGYLPIELVSSGAVKSAIACDINEGPLARGAAHIAEAGLTDLIETRLSNGLLEIEPGEVDVVSIAGMGGSLIIDILRQSNSVVRKCSHLVLQPQSNIDEFRAYLYSHGFSIVAEDIVFEDGKYYFPIKVKPLEDDSLCRYIYLDDMQIPNLHGEDLTYAINNFGECLLHDKHPVLLDYLNLRLDNNKQILQKLGGSHSERVEELAYENHIIEILISYLDS